MTTAAGTEGKHNRAEQRAELAPLQNDGLAAQRLLLRAAVALWCTAGKAGTCSSAAPGTVSGTVSQPGTVSTNCPPLLMSMPARHCKHHVPPSAHVHATLHPHAAQRPLHAARHRGNIPQLSVPMLTGAGHFRRHAHA